MEQNYPSWLTLLASLNKTPLFRVLHLTALGFYSVLLENSFHFTSLNMLMHGLCSVPKVCSFGCRNQRKESFTSFGSIVHVCVHGGGGCREERWYINNSFTSLQTSSPSHPSHMPCWFTPTLFRENKKLKLGLHFKTRIFHTQKLDFQFLLEKKPNKSEAVSKLGPTLACQMLS